MLAKILRNPTRLQPTEVLVVGALYLPVFGLVRPLRGADPRARQGGLLPRPGLGSDPMYVIGLTAFGHDSTAALVRDGELLALAEELLSDRVLAPRGQSRNPAASRSA